MVRAVAEEPKADLGHSCWSADYLLAHCEGYRVESDQGRLGYVEDVVWGPGSRGQPHSEPVALRVSGRYGRLTIPVGDVRELHAEGEWIVARVPAGVGVGGKSPAGRRSTGLVARAGGVSPPRAGARCR